MMKPTVVKRRMRPVKEAARRKKVFLAADEAVVDWESVENERKPKSVAEQGKTGEGRGKWAILTGYGCNGPGERRLDRTGRAGRSRELQDAGLAARGRK